MAKSLKQALAIAALIGSSCVAQTAVAACLNVGFDSWPATGWTASLDTSACLTASATAALDISTFQTGSDARIEADIMLQGSGSQASQGGLVLRSSGSYANGYLVLLHRLANGNSTVEVFKNGVFKTSQAISALAWNTAYHLRIDAVGSTLQVYFNNSSTPTLTYTDTSTPYTSGKFGLFRAGTGANFNNITQTALSATLHTSELGYQTYAEKRGLLRATPAGSALLSIAGASWALKNSSNTAVATGTVGAKTSKWGIDFYPIDFSSVTAAGTYTLEVTVNGSMKTSRSFKIGDAPLLQTDMYTIAVQQLEDRYAGPTPSALATTGMTLLGGYLPATGTARSDIRLSNNPGNGPVSAGSTADASPAIPKIWVDCSSNYTEMGSASIATRALVELYTLNKSQFSAANQSTMLTNIKRGADYIVGLQESHPGDSLRDGRFRHSLMVNLASEVGAESAWWAGNVHPWNNQGVGIVTLAQAYTALKNQTGFNSNATAYLTAAKKAWTVAKARPYYLAEDVEISNLPGYYAGYTFWENPNELARGFYGITDDNWSFKAVSQQTTNYKGLRSRELLEFLWASTSLYQITDESGSAKQKYLDEAVAVADELMSRQYLDHGNKFDGVYGMFREFSQTDANSGGHAAFLSESAQAGWVHLGNYIYTNLDGFLDLLKLAPTDAKAASWDRAARAWAEAYERPAAAANPFKIAPNTVYPDPNGDGSTSDASIYWFGNRLHGGSDVFGQAARSLLRMGNYLNDESYQVLANANVQMYTGLNPGAVLASTGEVKPTSMIKGVPSTSLAAGFMEPYAPKGSINNGFNSTTAFNTAFFTKVTNEHVIPADGPNVFGSSDESWIAHSHAYVMGAANLEAPHRVDLDFSEGAATVGATVQASFPANASIATRSYTVPSSGKLTITDLPLGQKVVLQAQRPGFASFALPVNTVGGGSGAWVVDWSNYLGAAFTGVPATASKSTNYTMTWTVQNFGSSAATPSMAFSGAGGTMGSATATATVPVGGSVSGNVSFTTGANTEPYSVRAVFTSGKNVQKITATGLIQ